MDISPASTTSKSNSINIGASSTSRTGNNNNNIRILEDMFEKVLSPRDIDVQQNRLVIAKKYAEKYFPPDLSEKILSFQERSGKIWTFPYSFRISRKIDLMDNDWRKFVKEKKFRAGDIISFHREIVDKSGISRFYVDWRHTSDMRQGYSSVPVREHYGEDAISGEMGSGSTIAGTSNPNREWNAFNSFLNARGLTLFGCRATDIIDFLCMQKNMGDSNALVCRLSAVYERRGVKPKDNPFRSLAVIRYLQLVRRIFRKTECIVFFYDVGEVTRKIIGMLHEKNVTPLTCNLSQENLGVEMFYKCSVGILVLSYSFARSSHSLDHLVTIMERWKAKDLVVIPVYYMVTLSDIMNLIQQQYRNYFQADKVPKWKAAITELVSITGHQYRDHFLKDPYFF